MRMIITAHPTEQILIKIIDPFKGEEGLINFTKVWYKDLYDTVAKLREEYIDLQDIILCGPEDYVVHIGETIHTMFEDNPINIGIMSAKWEIQEDDSISE